MPKRKNRWLIIIGLSFLLSFLFSLAREYRIFSHFLGLNFIEYFGYDFKAFFLSLPSFLIGLVIIYYLIQFFIRGSHKRKIIIFIIGILIISSLFYGNPVTLLNSYIPPIEPVLSENEIHVIFTLDTEEDWSPISHCYYDSYKYVNSGIFYQLIEGLAERDVSATFYVTPNLAQDIPQLLKYLESKDQTIGLHLHPHNLVNVDYPYCPPYSQTKGENIQDYSFAEKLELMKEAKKKVETVLGNEILLYRSGKLSCDQGIEKIAHDLGYQAISNHRGIYYIKPVGIYNLDLADDILDSEKFENLKKYIDHFESRAKKEQVVTFSAHPMRLYDNEKNQTQERQLELFLEFLDYLKDQKNIKIINQYQLLDLIKKSNGEK